MHLVLGLGNPGRKYERTRHNAGFLVVDHLGDRQRVGVDRAQLGALVASVHLGDRLVLLAKPQSFMNLSGQPAASLRGYYKVDNDDVIVIHDDVDLPFGDVRVKKGGGHGGHNGLRDLQEKLGTAGFVRVRVGVGRPPALPDGGSWETADWVLAPFHTAEEAALPEILARAADAVALVVQKGVDAAMNQVNMRRKESAS
jgi:PTH1 family peptidyl-tRNA hydrolase